MTNQSSGKFPRKWFPYTALGKIPEDASDEEAAMLNGDEKRTTERSPPATHRDTTLKQSLRRCTGYWSFVLAGVLAGGLITLVAITARGVPQIYPLRWNVHEGGTRKYQHCGTSPEEAIALGCEWDIMSYSWVHPACFNQAESQEWADKYGPWKWYPQMNSSKSEAIPAEDLPYSDLVYTEQGYHVVHCLYIWKLIHLAGMNHHLVTNEGIPFQHTDHCIKMIGNPVFEPFETITTGVHLLFGQCVSLD